MRDNTCEDIFRILYLASNLLHVSNYNGLRFFPLCTKIQIDLSSVIIKFLWSVMLIAGIHPAGTSLISAEKTTVSVNSVPGFQCQNNDKNIIV